MECVVNPPKEGDESYPVYAKEKGAVLQSLKERAELVRRLFDEIDGIDCNPVQGAMYAFPRVHIPKKAVDIAKVKDFWKMFSLLE